MGNTEEGAKESNIIKMQEDTEDDNLISEMENILVRC